MEIAIALAVLALIALAVMVVQSRPNRSRRYRDLSTWEVTTRVAGEGFEPEAPLHAAAPPPHPKRRNPSRSAPPAAPPVPHYPGAKALYADRPVSRFWAAVIDEKQ